MSLRSHSSVLTHPVGGAVAGSSWPRYAALDHWRGFACLWVLMYHTVSAIPGGVTALPPALRPLGAFASLGWFGVHLFFVISGYCVAVKARQLVNRSESGWRFICDRGLRIFPTYWVACALSVGLAIILAPFSNGDLAESLPRSWLGVLANLTLTEPYWGYPPLILVSWSLVFEVGFYLLIGAGMQLKLASSGWGLVLLLGFAMALAACRFPPQSGPLYVLRYWPEFFLGVMVLVATIPGSRAWTGRLGFLLGVGLLLWMAVSGPSPRSMLSLPGASCFALLLLLLYPADARLCRSTLLRPLAFVGSMSYSLYLIHLPVANRAMNAGLRVTNPASPWIAATLAGAWVAALVAGYLLYCGCERPLERRRHSRTGNGRRSSSEALLGVRDPLVDTAP